MNSKQFEKLETYCKTKLPRSYNMPIPVPNKPIEYYCEQYINLYEAYHVFLDNAEMDNVSDKEIEDYMTQSFTKRLVIAVQASRIYHHCTDLYVEFDLEIGKLLENTRQAIRSAREMYELVNEYQYTHDESVFYEGGEPLPRDVAWRPSHE